LVPPWVYALKLHHFVYIGQSTVVKNNLGTAIAHSNVWDRNLALGLGIRLLAIKNQEELIAIFRKNAKGMALALVLRKTQYRQAKK
jgi:hypothetical protein